jgi:surfeit locus 1 family protein
LALTVACSIMFVLLIGLGIWQLERLQWKLGLIAHAESRMAAAPISYPARIDDPAALDFRHVLVAGTFLNDRAMAFGAIANGNQLGARLVTPLRLADGRVLLVDRGWLPEAMLPPHVPAAAEPSGHVEVSGVLRYLGDAPRRLFTPANDPAKHRWFWFDGKALAHAVGEPVEPFILFVNRTAKPGELPAPAPVDVDYRNAHLGYAITWFSLAATLIVFYIMLGLRTEES